MRWTILWLLISLVASCGQKGPLYLPDDSGNPEAWRPAMAADARSIP